jgi:hypothetical protein
MSVRVGSMPEYRRNTEATPACFHRDVNGKRFRSVFFCEAPGSNWVGIYDPAQEWDACGEDLNAKSLIFVTS